MKSIRRFFKKDINLVLLYKRMKCVDIIMYELFIQINCHQLNNSLCYEYCFPALLSSKATNAWIVYVYFWKKKKTLSNVVFSISEVYNL